MKFRDNECSALHRIGVKIRSEIGGALDGEIGVEVRGEDWGALEGDWGEH